MISLYPLKFEPIFLDKIWGGQKIRTILGKEYDLPNCGETWELTSVPGHVSKVAGGPLKGQSLDHLILEYRHNLVGTRIFKEYGEEFPLLIKFISSAQDLSIQVHPDNKMAAKKHNGKGKTEMWYILDADEGASLITGFNRSLDKETYLDYFTHGKIEEILNREEVFPGDVFYLPAGRIHTIGKGILLAEIQQTSDLTYRIYDFDRRDDKGQLRELHTDLASEALDYTFHEKYKTSYEQTLNKRNNLVDARYFTTNKFQINKPTELSYNNESFHILIGISGSVRVNYPDGTITLKKGDVYLLPADIQKYTLVPEGDCSFLEVTA